MREFTNGVMIPDPSYRVPAETELLKMLMTVASQYATVERVRNPVFKVTRKDVSHDDGMILSMIMRVYEKGEDTEA